MYRDFFITDVFAEGPYSGNQLATLPDARGLSADEMQKIARAFNFAESTFITGGDLSSGFDVRIFTPNSELPFAGHPTLGTAFVIQQEILRQDVDTLTLNLGVGPIPVSFSTGGVLWMRQNPPQFAEILPATVVAEQLGLPLAAIDPRFPCQRVSTGIQFLLVPLTSLEALQAAEPRFKGPEVGQLLFCAQGYTSQQAISARMFAVGEGVPEDPATGSANGCLAAYLCEHEYFGTREINIQVGQGYEISRPSQLYLKANKRGADFSINVGGRVQRVARGQWLVTDGVSPSSG